jgi:hypothetical protein
MGSNGADAGVPRSADEVDAAWLTAALHPAAGSSARVVGVDAHPVGVGMGLLGQLRRYSLTWEDGQGPPSVVAKFPAPGDKSRGLAEALDMYPREVGFYRDLSSSVDLALDCHVAVIDEPTHDFVLVLEDMGGATTIDQLDGCPLDQAERVVIALADLHAGHWDEAGLDAAPWLGRLVDQCLPTEIATAMRACWPGVRDELGDDLGPTVLALGDGLADAIPRLTEALSRPPVTLTHGDVRLDNMFFDDADGLRLCDWQLTGRSRGMRDLAYFVTQSLTARDRLAAEADLVGRYLARLAARGVRGYDDRTAWDDYRAGTVFGFSYAVVALGGLDQVDDRSAALPRAMLDRSARAMVDLGCALPDG